MYDGDLLGPRQPEQKHQGRGASDCTWEAERGERRLAHLQREGKREEEWRWVEVWLGKRSGLDLQFAPTHEEPSWLSSDLSSARLLCYRGLGFCWSSVLQADLLSRYKRCLTKPAERITLCFILCQFRIRGSVLCPSRMCALLCL